MDAISESYYNGRCQKHPQSEVLFINMNQNDDKENLYYCDICLSEEDQFQIVDLLHIKKIVEEGDRKIIHKWPPVNNYKIIKDLIEQTEVNFNKESIAKRVVGFFDNLRIAIRDTLEVYQKKFINQVLELPNSDNIIEEYKSISKIEQLRQILIENKNSKMDKLEELNELRNKFQSDKDKNTLLLQNLLNDCQKKRYQFDIEGLQFFKESMLNQIKQLDSFNLFEKNDLNDSVIQIETEDRYSNLKSCSNELLKTIQRYQKQMKQVMNQLKSPGKKQNELAGNTESIEEQKLIQIASQIEHVTKLTCDDQYKNQIMKSQLFKLVQSEKNNNPKTMLDTQFNPYLLETYPYLQHYNEDSIYKKQNQVQFEFSNNLKASYIQVDPKTVACQTQEKYGFCLAQPKLDQQKTMRFAFKILKLVRWIGVGVCFANRIKTLQYAFNYEKIGNGYYLISSNNYTYSHSEQGQHNARSPIQFIAGDTIYIEFNPSIKQLKFKRKNQENRLNIQLDENEDLVPCVCMFSENEKVEIISDQEELNSIEFK